MPMSDGHLEFDDAMPGFFGTFNMLFRDTLQFNPEIFSLLRIFSNLYYEFGLMRLEYVGHEEMKSTKSDNRIEIILIVFFPLYLSPLWWISPIVKAGHSIFFWTVVSVFSVVLLCRIVWPSRFGIVQLLRWNWICKMRSRLKILSTSSLWIFVASRNTMVIYSVCYLC